MSEQDKDDWSKKLDVIPPEQRGIKVTSKDMLSEKDKETLRALRRHIENVLWVNHSNRKMLHDSIALIDRLLGEPKERTVYARPRI